MQLLYFLHVFSESNLQVQWLSPYFHRIAIALLAAGTASNSGSKILHFAQNAGQMNLMSTHKNSQASLMHWLQWETYSGSNNVQHVVVLKLCFIVHFFLLV